MTRSEKYIRTGRSKSEGDKSVWNLVQKGKKAMKNDAAKNSNFTEQNGCVPILSQNSAYPLTECSVGFTSQVLETSFDKNSPIPVKGFFLWSYKPGKQKKPLTGNRSHRRKVKKDLEKRHKRIKLILYENIKNGKAPCINDPNMLMPCINCGYPFWDDDEPFVCGGCKIEKYLNMLHPNIIDYKNIILLDIELYDFPNSDIISSNFLFIKLTDEKKNIFRNLFKDSPLTNPNNKNFDKQIDNSKYFFVCNLATHKITEQTSDRIWLHSRFENFLISKFSKTLKKRKIILAEYNISSGMLQDFEIGEEIINISLNDFLDVLKIKSWQPNTSDFDVDFIIKESEARNCLFRGVSEYRPNDDEISSSNYWRNPEFDKDDLQDHEQASINNLTSKNYYEPQNSVCALTDLRHGGADTNILDFSRNPRVSLFFACNGEKTTSTPSEFLILSKNELEEKSELSYPVDNDFILHPETQDSGLKERVKVQASEFVYCHKGFLSRNFYQGKMKSILIDNSLRKLLLEFTNFKEDDIYPDLHGFFENKENFKTPTYHCHEAKKLLEELPQMERDNMSSKDKNRQIRRAINEYEIAIEKARYLSWNKCDLIKSIVQDLKNEMNEN